MSRGGISLESVTVQFGTFALQRLDLAVNPGERLVVVGPNGAGKSVTLETIAGFHRATTGRILIRNRDVTRLPPEHRNVAFVLQNFGLFPHLSVRGNIALGLQRLPRSRRRSRLVQLMEQFGIGHLADRPPHSLSPGEKQRTGLARALAAEPDVFLFDEPFSALDAGTHARLRLELRDFLEASGIPAIFVTHDRTDAHALGTALAMMEAGVILQQGPLRDVLRAPRNRRVAELLGVDNIFAAKLRTGPDGRPRLAVAGVNLIASSGSTGTASDVLVGIRAEDIEVLPPGSAAPAENRMTARVLAVLDEGVLTAIRLDCGVVLQARMLSRTVEAMRLTPGAQVDIAIAPEAIHPMPPERGPSTATTVARVRAPEFRLRPAAGIVRS